ncbi:PqqD family protein [Janibacter cremeus]|uniref:PqqD family protein n=1 Tax=Janibacter cremeus TaxID=1285192 RepID=A0A852VUG0_9MICO|nr:PqqD family protein [Janibacter cremeus]NYF99040.1 hypothetical protein [Janibacter cremeus]
MTHRIPNDLAWTLSDNDDGTSVLYLARLPRGPISVLRGTAALIWLATTEGPRETVADRVADEAGVEVDGIRDEVGDFVDQLVAEGLLGPRSAT